MSDSVPEPHHSQPEPEASQPQIPERDDIAFDGKVVGFVDRDGNIRLASGNQRAIGHTANDRDHAIQVLRDRYLEYLEQTKAWREETLEAENRLWRIQECDRRMQEIDQQYVLGDFDVVREMLQELKQELLNQQQDRVEQRKTMIAEAESFRDRTDWKDAAQKIEELNQRFKAVGSLGDREVEQAQWDTFKDHERAFRAARKAHYDDMDRQFTERAQAKEAICIEAEEWQSSDEFRIAGQTFRELMDKWKEIGFAGREHDEALWRRFQEARTVFAERRKSWYEHNAKLKEDLASKAEALSQLEDSAAAHEQMKPLMQQWREVGSAGKSTDDTLWNRFRGAQESVYQRSREVFDARHRERQQNYEAKQALVSEAESLIGQDSRTATNRCKQLQQEWKQIGPVPRDLNEKQWARFRAACDAVFRMAQAEGKRRIEGARERAEEQIRKLSGEIDEHERKIAHWESVIANLRDGANADEIRASMEEKIATAKQRIEIKLVWIEEHHAHMTELGQKL